MKIIIALLFLRVLTNAFQLPPNGITRCLYIKTKEDLESDKFFTGTWFVTHAKNGSSSTVCREYSASMEGETIKLTGDGYYNVGLQRRFLEVPCDGLKKENEKAKFSLKCKQQTPSTETSRFIVDFELEVSVVETDYKNFAIVYMCTIFPQLGPFFNDDLLILHRDKAKVSSPEPKVRETLRQNYNFTLEPFRARDENYCSKVPKLGTSNCPN